MNNGAGMTTGYSNGYDENEDDSMPPFEPIAIIGMGCRWPGGSEQPSQLWDFLMAGKHGYSDFPSDRAKFNAFYHPKVKRPGSFYTPGGGYIKGNPYDFDRTFFGISAEEATSMDPSQRKLLEVMYEASQSAGVSLEELSRSATGCFVGCFNNDHQIESYRDAEYFAPFAVSGNSNAILANRVNHLFNLRGPSMTMDTACSSSLCALHYACSSIQNGDCTAAFVGGINLCMKPDVQIISCTLGSLSATGRCHTFDASADGYARSDGIGAFYMKNLSCAIRDRNPIRAVIRGTASNTNGKTAGITLPNADGQERLIRHAFRRARLEYHQLGYLECHGPGTEVGDPTEFDAMGRIFGESRPSNHPLLVGSVKSNFGHTEAASGMAGLMKVVLSLQHGVIPGNFGFEKPNKDIDFKDGRLKIAIHNEPWPDLPERIAGVGGKSEIVSLYSAESFGSANR